MSKIAIRRLNYEFKNIIKNPINDILVSLDNNDMRNWYYLIKSTNEPYLDGEYLGKIEFPEDYPMKPPAIKMITPNGRFKTDTKLCLSISSYHPETWNPSWSVGSVLIGLYSFMNTDNSTLGSIENSYEERQQLALKSRQFNESLVFYKDLFSDTHIDNENISNNKCRYCYDSGGELINPCECKGSNEWVHYDCLVKWQRSSLLSQSTHPDHQTNIESVCNVCNTQFKIKTANRQEIMMSFTGKELSDMVNLGFIIVCSKKHSDDIEKIKKEPGVPENLINNLNNWCKGVYFINDISSRDNDDSICAINLTNKVDLESMMIDIDSNKHSLKSIWLSYYNDLTNVNFKFQFYIGGPCVPQHITGLCILDNELVKNTNDINVIDLVNSDNKKILVAPIKILALFLINNKISNDIIIHAFFGFAGWGRTQLLGEMVKGSWGLVKMDMQDMIINKLWDKYINSDKLVFVKENEFMSK